MRYGAAVEEAVSRTGPDKSVDETMAATCRTSLSGARATSATFGRLRVHAPAAQVFGVLQGLGGKSGWPYANVSVATARMDRSHDGWRRHVPRPHREATLQTGDGVDFWRVEEIVPEKEFCFALK